MPSIDHELQVLQNTIATLLAVQDLDEGELAEVAHLLATVNNALPQTQAPPLAWLPPPPPHTPPVTPPPRLPANRWHTPVSLEQIVRGRLRYVKWFSDFQLAYMYVEGTIANDDNEDNDWIMADFGETADMMDTYWRNGEEGLPIARCNESSTVYVAYYEPQEAEAYRAAVEQQRHRNPIPVQTVPREEQNQQRQRQRQP